MPSNIPEVSEPAMSVEKLQEEASRRAVNRRNFMTAVGVAGVATSAALVSSNTSRPRTVAASSFTQIDVLNFALNLEYLEATFYSYVTQGTDLPPALTLGSGPVTGNPAKLTFTGTSAAQITDLLNEIYFDELNHVLALRSVLGSAAVPRPALNLAAYAAVTANNALSIARLLEDVGVTAYAGAAAQLSGTNLTYAAQILAVEGFHSGAIRLASIQNQNIAQYYPAAASTTFQGTTTSGSTSIKFAYFTSTLPLVGQSVQGMGTGAGAVITAISGANFTFTGGTTSGKNTIAVTTTNASLAIGQILTGTGIPAGSTITAITASVVTISANATATSSSGTVVTFTVGGGTVTTSVPAIATVVNGVLVTGNDPQDVEPADPGTAALAAAGPVANSAGEFRGFFSTTGTGNASEVNALGVAFARTTSQILSIVYAAGGVAPNPGVKQGGFFPAGVNGLINTI